MNNFLRADAIQPTDSRLNMFVAPLALKNYGFAIAIILGIGGLVVCGVGVAGYLGAISGVNTISAAMMITVGCGGGGILLVFGVTGIVKHYLNNKILKKNKIHLMFQQNLTDTQNVINDKKVKNTPANMQSSEKIQNKLEKGNNQSQFVFGPTEYKEFLSIEVADSEIPLAPEINENELDPYFKEPYRKNYILLYIPKEVYKRNRIMRCLPYEDEISIEKQAFNYESLLELKCARTYSLVKEGDSCEYLDDFLKENSGQRHGWVLISKVLVPGSCGKSRWKTYQEKKSKLQKTNSLFRMPTVLEAVIANLMVYAIQDKLYTTTKDNDLEKFNYYRIMRGRATSCVEEKFYDYDDDPHMESFEVSFCDKHSGRLTVDQYVTCQKLEDGKDEFLEDPSTIGTLAVRSFAQ